MMPNFTLSGIRTFLPDSLFFLPLGLMKMQVSSLLFFWVLLVFSAAGQAPKPSGLPAEKNQVKPPVNFIFEKKKLLIGILEKQETDWNQGNLKGFLSAYWDSDTLRSVSVRGIYYGKERLQNHLKSTFPDSASMGNLSYDVVHIELIGDNDALLTGKWLRKNDKKFRGGYFSILLRKLQGRWQIVAEHFG
jgi:hypothetical protein